MYWMKSVHLLSRCQNNYEEQPFLCPWMDGVMFMMNQFCVYLLQLLMVVHT